MTSGAISVSCVTGLTSDSRLIAEDPGSTRPWRLQRSAAKLPDFVFHFFNNLGIVLQSEECLYFITLFLLPLFSSPRMQS